jgi:hypothetical protein
VIAHNNVVHGPNWPTRSNGFRAWTWTASKEQLTYKQRVREAEVEWRADGLLTDDGWDELETRYPSL